MKIKYFVIACGIIVGFSACLLGTQIILRLAPVNEEANRFDVNSTSTANLAARIATDDHNLLEVGATTSPLVRNIQLRVALVAKDITALSQLLAQTDEIPVSPRVAEDQELLLEYIARIDPTVALARVWNYEFARWPRLVQVVFTEWVRLDPNRAMEQAASLYGIPRKTALMTIIETEPNSNQLVQNAESLGIVQEVEILRSEVRAAGYSADPEESFNLALSDPVEDDQQKDLIITLVESWIGRDGTDIYPELLSIVQQLDSQVNSTTYDSSSLSYAIIETMASFNPELMWSLVLKESSDSYSNLVRATLDAWIRIDIRKALSAVEDVEPASSSSPLYGWLVDSWARRDPQAVLNNIEVISTEHRRYTIAWTVRYVVQSYGVEEALTLLKQLEQSGENVVVATEFFAVDWAQQDPKAAVDWVLTSKSEVESERRSLLRWILPALSVVDADQALTIAQKNTDENQLANPSPLEAIVLESVAKHEDLNTVRVLLDKVNPARREAVYLKVGGVLISRNSIEEALQLGMELPKDQQPQYFESLTLTWLSKRPDTVSNHIVNLSEENARVVAHKALQFNKFMSVLTEEEIAFLESIGKME